MAGLPAGAGAERVADAVEALGSAMVAAGGEIQAEELAKRLFAVAWGTMALRAAAGRRGIAAPPPRSAQELAEALAPLGVEVPVAPDDAIARFVATLPDFGEDAGRWHEALLGRAPAIEAGRLALRGGGKGRKNTGSFYTPEPVVERVLDATLGRVHRPAVEVRVLDPACGAGAFLVPAARRLARRCVEEGAAPDLPSAARLVVSTCIFGLDLDPVALLIARLQLWLPGLCPGLDDAAAFAPLRALERHVTRGDALLGADGATIAAGIPDEAFAPRPDDPAPVAKGWRAENRRERVGGAGTLFPGPASGATPEAHAAFCAAFFWPREAGAPRPPTTSDVRASERRVPLPDATAALVCRIADERAFVQPEARFSEVIAWGGFDVVVGNPPFLNQLERGTVTTRAAAALLRARFGDAVGAYTDAAALFLLLGARLLAPGGHVGLVLPQSVLAARDATGVRAEVARIAAPAWAWWGGPNVFPGVAVNVVALAFARGGEGPVERATGLDFRALPPLEAGLSAETWTPLLADALGAPALHLPASRTLTEIAAATADFRDEYYGLVPHVVDRAEADEDRFPRLVLTGHIEPARAEWGARTVRFGRRAWLHPRVDREALEAGPLGDWARARRVPKILVATQTRVIEAVADPGGRWLTTTPTVTVLPADGQLWRVAAVLLGPVASAWGLARYGATALSSGTLKLAARQVLEIPLPTDEDAWDEAAALVERAHAGPDARGCLVRAAGAITRAYRADPGLVGWWAGRWGGAGEPDAVDDAPSTP